MVRLTCRSDHRNGTAFRPRERNRQLAASKGHEERWSNVIRRQKLQLASDSKVSNAPSLSGRAALYVAGEFEFGFGRSRTRSSGTRIERQPEAECFLPSCALSALQSFGDFSGWRLLTRPGFQFAHVCGCP